MTDKTQPIQLPIDPRKTYISEFGCHVTEIRYEGNGMYTGLYHFPGSEVAGRCTFHDDGSVSGSWSPTNRLVAEIAPKTQPRDFSQVLNKLCDVFQLCHLLSSGYGGFRVKALAILQEFDAQNKPESQVNEHSQCCQGCQCEIDMLIEEIAKFFRMEEEQKPFDAMINLKRYLEKNYRKQWDKYMGIPTQDDLDKITPPPTEEPIEWVVGELYEDSEGAVLEFVFDNRKKPLNDKYSALAFRHQKSGCIMLFNKKGQHEDVEGWNIIKKHTPKPVEHEIDCWFNVYLESDGYVSLIRNESKAEADMQELETRIACLHIKRTFVEGEGLV